VFAVLVGSWWTPLPAQSDCVEAIPRQAEPWVPERAEVLVGAWQVTMMNVARGHGPAPYRRFNLRLQKPDSVQHRVWTSVSLIGDIARDLPPIYQFHDPMTPPPVVLWDQSLQLGGFGTVDGPGYDMLRPQASTRDGFWGEWGHIEGFGQITVEPTDSGYVPHRIEPARGYFCASRLPQASPDSGLTAQ
jgi:hypothetical protein